MKTADEYFQDWQSETFGYGYGSGEPHILPALRLFFETVPKSGTYDFEVLEKALTPTVAWLFINILCGTDIIEYGTSPRYGWLTKEGVALRDYVLSKTPDELVELATNWEGVPCCSTYCNCVDEECNNPFWRANRPRSKAA